MPSGVGRESYSPNAAALYIIKKAAATPAARDPATAKPLDTAPFSDGPGASEGGEAIDDGDDEGDGEDAGDGDFEPEAGDGAAGGGVVFGEEAAEFL